MEENSREDDQSKELDSYEEQEEDDQEFFILRKRLKFQDISADLPIYDWQNHKSLWNRDASLLLWNAENTDCTFLVGCGRDDKREVIKCHRRVLSYASTVFASMLYGPLSGNEEVIEVTDIEPDTFKLMTSYFYTGKLEPSSVELGLALLYAAQKYLLTQLQQECYLYLMSNLRPDNILKCYEIADEIGYINLRDTSFKVICDSCETILCHPSFEDVKFSTLAAIVNEENLNLDSEANLISAAFRWAEKEASRRQRKIEPLQLRNVLGSILPKFRFLTMSPEDFTERFIHVNYFTLDEKNALLVNIISRDKLPLPRGFSETDRVRRAKFLKKPKFVFHESMTNASLGEGLIETSEANRMETVVKFSCDKNVRLIGVSFPERISNEEKILFDWDNEDEYYVEDIEIAIFGENHQLVHQEFYKEKITRAGINRCNFSQPVMLSSGKMYKLSATFNESGSYTNIEQICEVYQGHDISLRNTVTSKKLKIIKALHYSLF
ncbi:BTB/POZ domain-containing protein 6-like [Neocloeon triangulifer]|uniref:BTB/POZ domain-containing protein 6-like n=1 Tax=Neocloeon triangulifer TaxID=2078957 RepID=UPI00286FAD81|nr:BTB/POZ domain-containing protein 6-like [Neocloeon triangulifer]